MALDIGTLKASLTLDKAEFDKGLAESGKSLQAMSERLVGGAAVVGKYGAAMVAAGAALTAAMVNKGLQAVDAQAKLAQQLQSSVAGVQALTRVYNDAGLSSDQMRESMRGLTVAIGQAAQGGNAQAEAFKKLGIDAKSLLDLDADQRFAAMADAISQYGDAADKAAIAQQLFGGEGKKMLVALSAGGDAARAARQEIEAMGIALSDVDAAQVEAANDAMGRIGDLIDGVANRLAVNFAPIITAVSKMLTNTAIEAGGVGKAVDNAFGYGVEAAAFLMSAVDGVKRVFTITADGIVASFASVFAFIGKGIATFLETLNKVAGAVGIDMFAGPSKAVRQFADNAAGVVSEAFKNIDETIQAPMAGERFKSFVSEAKTAAEAAARAAVDAREAVLGESVVGGTKEDEAKKKAAEQEQAAAAERLKRLQESYMTEQEALVMKLEQERAIIAESRARGLIDEQEADALELQAMLNHETAMSAIQQEAADKRKAIAEAEAAAKQAILSKAFGGLTTLMNSESRKMFEVGKAAAIGQSLIATYTGMTEALKLGWPLGPIAAAAIGVTGFQNVAAIRAQQFGGGGSGARATGSNTAAVNAATEPVQNQPTQRTNITLVGDVFSREAVIGLLNSAMKDGFTLGAA